jgi:hypothetical protein
MEINYDDLIERIFTKVPDNPKSVTLDFVEQLSLKEIFEFLVSFFTDGSKILYGVREEDKISVDISKWTSLELDMMKQYLAMIGFHLYVEVENFNIYKNYDAIQYTNLKINHTTKLSELKIILKNSNKVYIVSFEFIR